MTFGTHPVYKYFVYPFAGYERHVVMKQRPVFFRLSLTFDTLIEINITWQLNLVFSHYVHRFVPQPKLHLQANHANLIHHTHTHH
jgi:hypothetical protein